MDLSLVMTFTATRILLSMYNNPDLTMTITLSMMLPVLERQLPSTEPNRVVYLQ